MDRQKLLSAIETALAEVLERDVPPITEDTRFFEDLFLDSTSVLELLVSLEDHIGIDIDPEELDMDDFTSVGSLASRLEGRPAASAPAGATEA
ncbi:acyl carrier protein [Streptomyces sp. NPDC046215]|uniref:Carrier domain-containing protein n=1 Tax=Streptomyces stramineus TaxID=173861 RepID=A0ABN1ARV4_9ACTN